jgi:hypothetical protein
MSITRLRSRNKVVSTAVSKNSSVVYLFLVLSRLLLYSLLFNSVNRPHHVHYSYVLLLALPCSGFLNDVVSLEFASLVSVSSKHLCRDAAVLSVARLNGRFEPPDEINNVDQEVSASKLQVEVLEYSTSSKLI